MEDNARDYIIDSGMKLLGQQTLANEKGRRSFQSLCFLMQCMAGEHNYKFDWRNSRPYSETLEDEMSEKLAAALRGYPTTKNKDFLQIISGLEEGTLNAHELLDISASYEFVKRAIVLEGRRAIEFITEHPDKKSLVDRLCPNEDYMQIDSKLGQLSHDMQELIRLNLG
ncbi:MAG TPA: hypothetical protein HA282_04110 [Nanoarchaeota archaeon]|nr:MAG: hypothetical protein QT01_C0004G0011 [archaeon GW2011_AR6]MBS3082628.1 hypothetical protein [Candidatus Pacearchaeota archaeon]HIH17520.1 hypothetical protein [Nanoarchaeota archaeon]HIH33706.1 hypothetical protein [Nanoarchaeota archaeon]HIH51494.1 hypothetical protein [Nanoarchaeota archaeon]